MSPEAYLMLVPTTTYGDGRRCVSGKRCVTGPVPTVLSRYNSSDKCYCCQARDRKEQKAKREQSTEQVMKEPPTSPALAAA
jgi:hypothetical protein